LDATLSADFITGLGNRNTSGYVASSRSLIVDATVNDIATTQLDNAPVDEYGVKGVTWAVATDGGVSVGRTDGNVWDLTYSSLGEVYSVVFRNDGALFFTHDTLGRGRYTHVFKSLPSADITEGDGYQPGSADEFYTGSTGTITIPSLIIGGVDADNGFNIGNAYGQDNGLALLKPNLTDSALGLVNYLTTDYQSGWLAGDIKGAWLADSDDTDVTGSELVTNGTFDSDTDWTKGTGWSIAAGKLTSAGGNTDQFVYQTVAPLTVGETVVLTFDIDSITGTLAIYEYDGGFTLLETFTTLGAKAITYVVTKNNFLGLVPYGTITKTALGGDGSLVASSGYSAANYFEAPYNSDLDFSTGDFYVMGWVKTTSSGSYILMSRSNSGGTGAAWQFYLSSNELRMYLTDDGYSTNDLTTGTTLSTDTWHHVVAFISDGVIYQYLNGALDDSAPIVNATGGVTNATAKTSLGIRWHDSINPATNASLALWRIGAGAPSSEDIEFIYKQEKPLIVNGARAVLGGSSDAIASLAWDDYKKQLYAQSGDTLSTIQGSTVVATEASTADIVVASDGEVVAE